MENFLEKKTNKKQAIMTDPNIPKVNTPKIFHDPNTIRHNDLYKYVSRDSVKIQQSMLNYKRAGPYLGGILAGCLVLKLYVDSKVNDYIYGDNGNGGEFLTMYTNNTNYDMSYNRVFQRMRYLCEEPAGDDPYTNTRDELLVDLGFKVEASGINRVVKKVPHDKYL